MRLGRQPTRPAYAYMLAFKPDGQMKLCYPGAEAQSPSLSAHSRLRVPPNEPQAVAVWWHNGQLCEPVWSASGRTTRGVTEALQEAGLQVPLNAVVKRLQQFMPEAPIAGTAFAVGRRNERPRARCANAG
jgi:hypothetical protein